MVALLIVLLIAAIIVLWAVASYNSLVKLKNRGDEAEAGIDAHLKQRSDLIPNLVETVKGYASHESATLEAVVSARNRAGMLSGSERMKAENELSGALGRLLAVAEGYPELKANQQFLHLQVQIEDMENELQAIRRTYNAAATDYNNYIEMFPSSIIASWRKHEQQELIEFPESEIKEVKVGELFK